MKEEFVTKDLEILIKQAKNGNKDSFSILYKELYTPLFRFVLSRTRDKDKSLDICQDVFLRWYRSLESYEIKMKPLSYLMMISMRLIINDSKKSSSVSLPEDAEEFIEDEDLELASETFDFNTDLENIRDLFDELSENQKNVLTMRYVADADTETIAEALDTTHANVRKLESRALKKIKELYEVKHGNKATK